MKHGDPQALLEELADPEFVAARAPVRLLESTSSLPTWVRRLLGEKEEKRTQSKEIESTAELKDAAHRDRIAEQLTKDGAEEIMHADLEAKSYEFKNICVLVGDDNQQACARMTARVRIHTHKRAPGWKGWVGLSREGLVEYFWTVKVRMNDSDEMERLEFEGPARSTKDAINLLKKKVQELLKLKTLPRFDDANISLKLEKTRRSFKYLKNAEPPRPCTGSRVDIDTVTKINGKKLKKPIYMVDVEGPSVAAIAECRNCLGLGSNEFSLRGWMKQNNFS